MAETTCEYDGKSCELNYEIKSTQEGTEVTGTLYLATPVLFRYLMNDNSALQFFDPPDEDLIKSIRGCVEDAEMNGGKPFLPYAGHR